MIWPDYWFHAGPFVCGVYHKLNQYGYLVYEIRKMHYFPIVLPQALGNDSG
jgi:hypothetical protein